jgi:hypothetical protein
MVIYKPIQTYLPTTTKSAPSIKTQSKPKPRKSKSTQTIGTRRSQRLISSGGTNKTQDEDVPVNINLVSDEEETREDVPITNPPSSPKISQKSKLSKTVEPKKAPPTLKDKGKQKAVHIPKVSSKKDSAPKNPITKNLSVSKPKYIPLFDDEFEEDFKLKWSTRPIAVGRYVNFHALEQDEVPLREYTDKLGWSSFLQIREKHYPKVIRAFYSQAETYADKSLFVSTIKGVKISLTPKDISEIFNIPNIGSCVYGDSWMTDLNINPESIFQKILKPTTTELTCSNLQKIPKMLSLLSQHSLVPRCGNHGAVTKNDLMIIYHLFFKKRLCLPHVIMQHMIAAARDTHKNHCLPYGMMLTKIFLKKNVPLDGEESILEYTKFTPKNISHMKSEPFSSEPAPPSDQLKRKREENEPAKVAAEAAKIPPECSPERSAERSQQPSPVLEEHQNLLAEFGNQISSFSAYGATEVLRGFTSNPSPPIRVSQAADLFISPPKTNFSELFRPDSVNKFFNQFPKFDSSVPLDSFRTIQSSVPTLPGLFYDTCPSFPSMNERPSKRSKIEEDSSKIMKEIARLSAGQQAIIHRMEYESTENQRHREWVSQTLSNAFKVPLPNVRPYRPPRLDIPIPDASSSSDASSPTIPFT